MLRRYSEPNRFSGFVQFRAKFGEFTPIHKSTFRFLEKGAFSPVMNDPIVQEVRDARAAIAAEFNYDLPKYLAWIRRQTEARKLALGKTTPTATIAPTHETPAPRAIRKRREMSVKPQPH